MKGCLEFPFSHSVLMEGIWANLLIFQIFQHVFWFSDGISEASTNFSSRNRMPYPPEIIAPWKIHILLNRKITLSLEKGSESNLHDFGFKMLVFRGLVTHDPFWLTGILELMMGSPIFTQGSQCSPPSSGSTRR